MKLVKLLLAALLASCVFSVASGASYMKIEGVKGESRDSKHKDWIDVLSVSGLPTKDAASGMASGKRQHKPLTITKRIDKASPLFAESSSSGNNPLYQSAMSIEQDGVVYELSGVKVEKVEKKGKTEIVTLRYTGIKARHDAAMNSIRNMKAVAPSGGGDPGSGGGTRAQDYNSSRSNNESSDGVAAPANHNTTRSNKTSE